MYNECILVFFIVVNQVFLIESLNGEVFVYSIPSHCDRNEYFNTVLLKCLPCESNKHLESSADKLSCVCNKKSKIVSTISATLPVCEPCRNNEVLSSDKRFCIPCSKQILDSDNATVCEKCSSHQIRVERELNGSLKNVHCLNCTNDTFPSFDGKQCVPCNNSLPQGDNCKCPDKMQKVIDGICMPKSILTDFPEDPNTFSVTYDSGIKVDSIFLRMYLRKSLHMCKEKNITACQICANICTMLMYDSSYKSSPCRLFHDIKQEVNLKSNMLPWIYYGEGDAPAVVSRKKITSTYTLDLHSENSRLNLTTVHFSPHGILTDISTDVGSKIQLCPESWSTLNSGFLFGHRYQHTCTITAKQLFNSRETEFLELYLQYWKEGESLLYAVPLLVLNLKGGKNNNNNKVTDNTQWLLTRRFFLIDKISGVSADIQKSSSDNIPSVVQYMKHCTLRVKLQGSEEEGHIYPPLLVIEYGELTSKDINDNIPVTLSFNVEYEMSSTFSHSVEVSMGVLCGLSVVWTVIETWSNSRRSGRVAVDLFTLVQLCLFACGNLSNVFFLVVSSASLYSFVFYKGQSVAQIILPSQSEDDLIKTYVIIAFTLKIIEVIHFIAKQVSIDIFFIDWERPRARSSIVHPHSASKKNEVHTTTEQPVSIWRTYFVANEWNEIQTKRKVNIIFQMIITIFILKILGVEYWALANPELQTELSDVTKNNPPSLVFRFAVGVCIYTFVYSLQWLFVVLVYERYVKNGIQEFVDICSMANVSVFILVLENYGFYIHGRSPHGFADTDMQSMTNQLQREEEDLCSHRGLLPGTDQQTFQMTVPTQLRAYYRKVITPISSMMQINKQLSVGGGFRAKLSSGNIDKSIQAYHNMNKFLSAFFEHALKDLDFEVRDKLFMESLLDIEFAERLDKGVLYNDNGHSFDRVLFYGSEYILSTFEILTFSFVEVISQDYLLAAIVTIIVSKILSVIRSVAGRRNLAKKTLIDERFLV